MKILLIVAMQEELQSFLNHDEYEHLLHQGFDYYYLKKHEKEICLVKTEVGKVNAAILTTVWLNYLKPQLIINAGIGGSLHTTIPLFSTIFSSKVAYFDVDLTAFGLPLGQLDNMDLFFKPYKKHLLLEANDYHGLIVSSDTFVHTKDQKSLILQHFPKALVCDMEGASIAHVSSFFKRKFMIIRTISDIVGENNTVTYLNQKQKAMEICVQKTIQYIENIH